MKRLLVSLLMMAVGIFLLVCVKAGERVRQGQEIGRSGSTGLVGGDHLHFSMQVDGVTVNPTEWWDPHWIRNRILARFPEQKLPGS